MPYQVLEPLPRPQLKNTLMEGVGDFLKRKREDKQLAEQDKIYRQAAEQEAKTGKLQKSYKYVPGKGWTISYDPQDPLDASKILDTIKLQQVLKTLGGQGQVVDQQTPEVPQIASEVPQMTPEAQQRMEKIPTGVDPYGRQEYKTQMRPEYKAELDVETARKKEIASNELDASKLLNAIKLQQVRKTLEGQPGAEQGAQPIAPAPQITPPMPGAPQAAPPAGAMPQRTERLQTGIDPYGIPEYKTQLRPEYKAALDIETTWKKEITKNKKSAMENFNGVAALLQNTVGVWRAAAQEKEQRGVPAGLMSKHAGKVAEGLDLAKFPYTKAYSGQVIETAMALSKIITGGARIIRSVINQLIKTLPTDNRRTKDMEAKVSQTFRNSFARALGRQLTKGEMGYISGKLRELLDTPAATIPKEGAAAPQFKRLQAGGREYNIPVEEVMSFINSSDFKDMEIYDMTR